MYTLLKLDTQVEFIVYNSIVNLGKSCCLKVSVEWRIICRLLLFRGMQSTNLIDQLRKLFGAVFV